MFNLHPSHLCRLCLLKKEKLKHIFQQRIFTSHWCWNIFVFKTLMLKYICLTLMLKYICLKRMSKYIFQLRETSPATGVSSAFSAAAAAVVVVTAPSAAAAVVVVVASASCPRVPAIPDRTNITCSQVWALFAPSWLQYTQVSNFLRHMKTNFSDETLSVLHAGVLPHCCHPDSVFHFQESLTAHLYLCYIAMKSLTKTIYLVSCFLFPVFCIRMK